ncbi:hypothetical protein [Conexibacter sp. CPCC 206217]|uniref:hypothetical protein n=1 Tax=Conexibacter sp. CPCC 206217 TaxID=3064574 RepID=UPI0027222798|nr:hypothetical protein [Conexibacter sp. CPCC 206217]MDO8209083.1 hypothetical protein [Conexibacter sp. CPCC 206217]
MGFTRNSSLVALAVVAGALCAAVPSAEAARRPTRAEGTAIKRLALEVCPTPVGPCRYSGARVSTRNPRFAWANAIGEGFSGALVKRPRPHGTNFKVVGTGGGGISSCSYWRKRAPRPVLRDLRIGGLLNAAAGTSGNCG